MNKEKWYLNIWDEGNYFDLWTVTHILAGLFFYGLFRIFNLDLEISFLFLMIFIILWEVYEVVFKIKESLGNKIIDFVLQIFAFFLMHYVWLKEFVNNWVVFGLVVLVLFVLEIWGFIAYKVTLKKSLIF